MSDGDEEFDRGSRPQIEPTIAPVMLSPDEVHFRAGPWSGPRLTLSDEEREGKLADLIDQFDGTQTLETIFERFDDEDEPTIRHVVRELANQDILTDGTKTASTPATDRSPLPVRFSLSDRAVLDSKSVLVVSSGAIGTHLTSMLSDAGIGGITVRHRERDRFDESASAEELDPETDSLRDEIAAVDMVVVGVDDPWPTALEQVNAIAQETDTPFVYTEVVGFDVNIGPTVIPGETACYECYRQQARMNIDSPDRYEAFERQASDRSRTTGAVLPFAQIASGFVVTDVVNYLCYGYGYTVGSVISYGMNDFSFESNDVLRMPRCESCDRTQTDHGTDSLFTVETLVSEMSEERPDED